MSPSEHVGFAVAQFCSTARRHADAMAEYDRTFRSQGPTEYDDAAAEFVHRSVPEQPILDSDLWSFEWMDQRPEVKFMRDRMNWYRQFVFNLSHDPLLYAGMLVKYEDGRNHIPEDDILLGTGLAPHIAKALDLNRWADGLRQKYQAVLSVLDNIELGVCISDARGNIILHNRHASEIFANRNGLWLGLNGRLQAGNPEIAPRIQDAITSVAQTATGANRVNTVEISVPRSGAESDLLVIASPLRDANMELEPNLTGCLLTVVDPDRNRTPRIDAFADAYGLTPMENKASKLLMSGLTTPQIAEELGVATSTAQTHVKSIFAKTRSTNRVNFAWKAVQYSPPIV